MHNVDTVRGIFPSKKLSYTKLIYDIFYSYCMCQTASTEVRIRYKYRKFLIRWFICLMFDKMIENRLCKMMSEC
jgi:hypothetical protein